MWPVAGASPDGDPEPDGDTDGDTGDTDPEGTGDGDTSGEPGGEPSPDPDPDDGDKPLGEKGEKALAAEKDKRKAEQKRRRDAEKKVKDLEAEVAALRKAATPPAPPKPADDGQPAQGGDPTPEPVDVDAIRAEVREQMLLETARQRVLDRIEIAAAKKFADSKDAVALLMQGKTADDFLDDGKPDDESIQDAIAELLKTKPYLGVSAQGGKRFQGSGDGGPKPPKPQRPRSLGEAVTRALTPK